MSFEQSDHPAVVEPVSDFPGRLGSVDHGPRAGYAGLVDQGVIQSGRCRETCIETITSSSGGSRRRIDRFLEYRLGDGWEPICAFFGKGGARGSVSEYQRSEAHAGVRGTCGEGGSMKNGLWNGGRVLLPVVCAIW